MGCVEGQSSLASPAVTWMGTWSAYSALCGGGPACSSEAQLAKHAADGTSELEGFTTLLLGSGLGCCSDGSGDENGWSPAQWEMAKRSETAVQRGGMVVRSGKAKAGPTQRSAAFKLDGSSRLGDALSLGGASINQASRANTCIQLSTTRCSRAEHRSTLGALWCDAAGARWSCRQVALL